GNASSRPHAYGCTAEDAVDLAREHVARLIRASREEMIFTSGATVSVNLGLKGIFESYRSKGDHLITTATEHSCVLDTCKYIERSGGWVTYLPVKPDGLIDRDALREPISDDTIFISIMHANNET